MLGVRPIGSLSLYLTIIYFVGISVLILLPGTFSAVGGQVYVIYLAALILVGSVFFILPLYTTHLKMVEAKLREQQQLRSEMLLKTRSGINDISDNNREIREAIDQLTTVLNVTVRRDEVISIPTWPFDISIVGRLFMSFFLPMIAAIISYFITRRVLML
jgi:hypothetical protein